MIKVSTAILALSVSVSVLAQPAPTTTASYVRARRLVDQSVAAHGGIEALRGGRWLDPARPS